MGSRQGKGTYSTVQGDIYQGDFNENRMHGEGTYQWSNGDKYSGTYLNGKRHGLGEFVWANGERYEGWFLDDYMSGKGTMVYLDESRYVGNFEKNLRSGYGELFSTLGGAFKGFYRNDQPEGYGVRLTIEEEVILEYWVDGGLDKSRALGVKEECKVLHEGRNWFVVAENCIDGFAHGQSAMVDKELRVLVPEAFLVLGRLVEGEILNLSPSQSDQSE